MPSDSQNQSNLKNSENIPVVDPEKLEFVGSNDVLDNFDPLNYEVGETSSPPKDLSFLNSEDSKEGLSKKLPRLEDILSPEARQLLEEEQKKEDILSPEAASQLLEEEQEEKQKKFFNHVISQFKSDPKKYKKNRIYEHANYNYIIRHNKRGKKIYQLKFLGQGGFGDVYERVSTATLYNNEVNYLPKPKRAIKFITNKNNRYNAEGDMLKDASKEALVGNLAHGDGFKLRIRSINISSSQKSIAYIKMPYFKGPTLQEFLDKKNEKSWGFDEKLDLAIEVAKENWRVFSMGIVHCDLKPCQYLINMDEKGKPTSAKLVDFGLAIFFNEHEELKQCGTPQYLPKDSYNMNQSVEHTIQVQRFTAGLISLIIFDSQVLNARLEASKKIVMETSLNLDYFKDTKDSDEKEVFDFLMKMTDMEGEPSKRPSELEALQKLEKVQYKRIKRNFDLENNQTAAIFKEIEQLQTKIDKLRKKLDKNPGEDYFQLYGQIEAMMTLIGKYGDTKNETLFGLLHSVKENNLSLEEVAAKIEALKNHKLPVQVLAEDQKITKNEDKNKQYQTIIEFINSASKTLFEYRKKPEKRKEQECLEKLLGSSMDDEDRQTAYGLARRVINNSLVEEAFSSKLRSLEVQSPELLFGEKESEESEESKESKQRRRSHFEYCYRYIEAAKKDQNLSKLLGNPTDDKDASTLYGLAKWVIEEKNPHERKFYCRLAGCVNTYRSSLSVDFQLDLIDKELLAAQIKVGKKFSGSENSKELQKIEKFLDEISRLVFKIKALASANQHEEKKEQITILLEAVGSHHDEDGSSLLGLVTYACNQYEDNKNLNSEDLHRKFVSIVDAKLKRPAARLHAKKDFLAAIKEFFLDVTRRIFGISEYAYQYSKENSKAKVSNSDALSTRSTIDRMINSGMTLFPKPCSAEVKQINTHYSKHLKGRI